jgi:putative membrane protein
MMMWDHYGDWGWGGWIHWILTTTAVVVFWVLVIAAIVLLIRYLISVRITGGSLLTGRGIAENLLAERYARGEIDDDEYQHRLTLLRHSSGPVRARD